MQSLNSEDTNLLPRLAEEFLTDESAMQKAVDTYSELMSSETRLSDKQRRKKVREIMCDRYPGIEATFYLAAPSYGGEADAELIKQAKVFSLKLGRISYGIKAANGEATTGRPPTIVTVTPTNTEGVTVRDLMRAWMREHDVCPGPQMISHFTGYTLSAVYSAANLLRSQEGWGIEADRQNKLYLVTDRPEPEPEPESTTDRAVEIEKQIMSLLTELKDISKK